MSTGIDGIKETGSRKSGGNRNPTRAVYYYDYDYDYDDRGSPTGNVGGLHGRTRDQVSGGGCNVDDGSHDVYRSFNAGTFFTGSSLLFAGLDQRKIF
ncbi:hypothetical protein B296_00047564 [Ensete ventricosum]|uniref:Uncharacterized protein n=1 Tax=Ensete ventricosum TaxID=4639 RepID=A0A426XE13_ENSVE|nr:hypothetical protein B296_00047564 [Ensete ventricosum]